MQEAVLNGQSDDALLARFREGDRAAFGELYDRYSQRIFGHIFRLVANRATAEELTQEAFLRAFAQLTKGVEIRDVSAWIFRLATNLAVTYLRSRPRWGECLDSEDVTLPDKEDPNGDQGTSLHGSRCLGGRTAAEPVAAGGARSPLPRRPSYEQIASTFHKPAETVKVLLHKGKHRVRTELAR